MVLILPTPKPLYSKLTGINLWGFKHFFVGQEGRRGEISFVLYCQSARKEKPKKKKSYQSFCNSRRCVKIIRKKDKLLSFYQANLLRLFYYHVIVHVGLRWLEKSVKAVSHTILIQLGNGRTREP